ncbi:MAG: 5'-nucleotidase SurE [Chitinophagales bacterium]|nr:MAG: 5'-nucleotidase SurE [Chitinophagales bacterium]
MSTEAPLILVTNDDGVSAPGLRALVDSMTTLGKVVVVAPDKPQSGMGHAITIGDPLRVEKVSLFGDIEAYQCSGTPVDCVKLAKDKILRKNPDLCVSGINHGSNSSINVIYSGTMSAAVEASIEGIKAIGFSLLDYSFEADFTASKHYAHIIARQMLEKGLPQGTLLNVNIPRLPLEKIKGMKVCRQAHAKWEEDYDERVDPRGHKYYWLTGKFVSYDQREDTDEWALKEGYVSIVPVQFDLTAFHAMEHMHQKWDLHV